jgi:hypothetical protein
MDFSKIQNPRVRQYLEDKYAKQQDLDAAKSNESLYGGLADAAASLGTAAVNSSPKVQFYNRMQDLGKAPKMGEGYEGKVDASPVKEMLKRRTADAQGALAKVGQDFDEQNKLDTYSRNESDYAEKSDPMSKTSKTYQELAKRYMPGQDWSNISAAQLEKSLPILGKAYEAEIASKDRAIKSDQWNAEMEYKRDQDAANRGMKEQELGLKAQELNRKAEPVAKPATEDERKRFDNVQMGLKALDLMETALKEGQNTVSMMGDNDFTVGAREFEEALGRMQSGGAIQEDEAKRFRAMLPSWSDSAEMQSKKLKRARAEMQARMGTLQAGGKALPQAGQNEGKPFDWEE